MFDVLTHDDRPAHERTSRPRVFERLELFEHFRHLVPTLATPHVDDDVDVGELGDRLLEHRLAGAEAARENRGAAARQGKQEIDAALAGDQRLDARELVAIRPRQAYRPVVKREDRPPVRERRHRRLGVDVARRDGRDHALGLHRQNPVLERPFVDVPHRVAEANRVPRCAGGRKPQPRDQRSRGADAARAQERTALLPDALQRPLQPVEHLAEQARAEPHRQFLAGGVHRLADTEPARTLIHLDDGAPLLQADDLAHQALAAERDALVEFQPLEVDARGRAGNRGDAPGHRFTLT